MCQINENKCLVGCQSSLTFALGMNLKDFGSNANNCRPYRLIRVLYQTDIV